MIRCFVAIVAVFLCGCPVNLDTEYFAKNRPDQDAIAGKYVPSPDTLKWIRDEGKYPEAETSLLLAEDSSFQMSHMPDWWHRSFGEPKGGFDSGTGRWQLVKHQEWWDVELTFKSRRDFSSDPEAGGLVTSFMIVGQSPPYKLWRYVGDPDEGKAMVFQKESGGP